MTYRKFSSDYLFTGRDIAAPNSVLVTTEEGRVEAILPTSEAGEGIEYLQGMLSPGFVNCHCHLELSHMKGILPERTGLVDFLLAVMKQRGAAAPVNVAPAGGINAGATGLPDHIHSAIAAAELSMLDNGIVAVGDICNTTDTLSQKAASRLLYHNFIETMGFMERSAPDRFAQGLSTFRSFTEARSLVPHAPYSVSSALFGLIADFADSRILTIHSQESEAENDFYLSGQGDFLRLYQAMGLDVSFFKGTGKRSLESFLPHFQRDQPLILVHNVATNEGDLQFARQWPHLFFCLCPNANLYISGQLPDLDLLISQDCPIVVGTDSLASNHQLSILEEIRTLQREFPHLPTTTLLQWATLNGAEALQMDTRLGSFIPGKQPGIVLLEQMEGQRLEKASVRRIL